MKKSELQQIIREEVRKSLNNAPFSPHPVYDNFLDAYRKMEKWLTKNISTKQSVEIKRAFSIPYGPMVDAPAQAEEYVKELVEAEEILLNDGNILSLSEETKQQILKTYGQLEEDSKEYFWQQLTESVTTFGKINEFCRLNSAK